MNKLQKLANLKLKQKKPVDKDAAYAEGLAQKCASLNVDPQHVLDLAKILEIRL